VIDRDQYLVGDRHHGPLVPAPCLETGKFVSQVSAFGSGRRVGRLHQSALQIHIATGDAGALALAGGFVVAGTRYAIRILAISAVQENEEVKPVQPLYDVLPSPSTVLDAIRCLACR